MTISNFRKTLTCLSAALLMMAPEAGAATWTKLTNLSPASPGTMFLLTDGTVMVQNGASWMRLTPDSNGSYANGIWTAKPIAPMSVNRLYYASTVLPNGKVLIVGGEYTGSNSDRTDTNTGEIYDPVTNSWSQIAPYPNQPNCGTATVTSAGTTVNGSNTITGLEYTGVLQVGWTVQGTGIPDGATITSIDSLATIHISAAAILTGTPALSFTGDRPGCFGAIAAILLNNGNFLTGNLLTTATYQYNPGANFWTVASPKVYDQSDEEGWVKLPGGGIFNPYAIFHSINSGSGFAELYDSLSNLWAPKSPGDASALGTLPLLTSDALGSELGATLRLQDGRILLIGANNLTALYNPATNTWAAGPTIVGTLNGIPAPFGSDDAPAAILPNGHVIFAADAGAASVTSAGNTTTGSAVVTNIPSTATFQSGWPVTDTGSGAIDAGTTILSVDSPTQVTLSQPAAATTAGGGLKFGGTFSAPTQLFDFNPAGAGSITPLAAAIPDANLNTTAAFVTRMLMLPTGQLLFADSSTQLYLYTPDGAASPAYKPVINSVVYAGVPGVFTLTGKQLNGQSAGAAFGDDVQTDESYPVVRFTNAAGTVYYCRTTNWSLLGVATGIATAETVTVTVPGNLPPGSYSVVVTGAGIQSVPMAVTVTSPQLQRPN